MKEQEETTDKLRNELKSLIEEYKDKYAYVLQRKDKAYLVDYVNREFTKIADPNKYKLSTKCWYVMNGYTEFVKCKGCGHPITRNIFSMTYPIMEFCCVKCVNKSEESHRRMREGCRQMSDEEKALKVQRRKKTCLDLYGDENYRNDEQREKTLQSHYGKGVTNSFQAEEVKRQSAETCMNLYGKPYYSQTDEYLEKAKRAHLNSCGYEWSSQCPEVKEKTSVTNEDRYGGKSPMSSPEVQEKSRKKCFEKYGVESPSQCLEIKKRQRETYVKTCSERYAEYGGHPSKDPTIKKKISDTVKSSECQQQTISTTRERYGVDFSSQCREIRLKQQRRYLAIIINATNELFPYTYIESHKELDDSQYSKVKFDSSPEIAFYIWHHDHNIEFEYQPEQTFEYEYAGKKHVYVVDFKVDNTFYEIKGDHMIDDNGKWICPWNRSRDGIYEAKHQCALNNDVVILLSSDYKKYIDYINDKYGKTYLKSFRYS